MDDISSIPDSPIATSTPTLYDVSVMPHASQILSALLNSTDEGSTGMLAALRVGLPWKEVDRVNHSTILLQESPQPWLDTAPPALSHEQHEHANVGLSDMTYSMLFSFDRRIWMRELVRYNKSSHATPNAEYIQVVADPMADSDATTFEAPSAAVNGPSNSGLRWTYQVPLCAVASMVDIGDLRCPFVKMYLDMSAAINMGMNVQTLFGSHAHISALSSEETYMKAPRLSQGIASMVNSMKLEGDEGHVPRTRCALMWLYWLLWRWLLDTSAASFQALPRMLRPTPWQMTVAHPLVFDFVTSPGLRDHLCQQGVLECKWLTAACASLSCDDTPEDFYYIDPFTGELDISLAGKAHICRPDSWSFGPDMRQFFYNIDMYMRVRPPATAR
ncbi:hypothetical protein AMS68_006973 [Peltaster fructicola]|uniref:Uncharacterized protein n=1 Tax=Peltaster fructicola TaxID=286661 RepID=A0A6H0Y3C9_9PEZI|nr:hypothetical protein AMS68_006973 [Peltaster fructicola]